MPRIFSLLLKFKCFGVNFLRKGQHHTLPVLECCVPWTLSCELAKMKRLSFITSFFFFCLGRIPKGELSKQSSNSRPFSLWEVGPAANYHLQSSWSRRNPRGLVLFLVSCKWGLSFLCSVMLGWFVKWAWCAARWALAFQSKFCSGTTSATLS